MGWRDVLRTYGPAILTAYLEAMANRPPAPLPAAPPEPPAPTPAPVVPIQQSAPISLEQRYGDQADRIYFEIMGRPCSRTDNGVEKYTACLDLEAGREAKLRDELWKRSDKPRPAA